MNESKGKKKKHRPFAYWFDINFYTNQNTIIQSNLPLESTNSSSKTPTRCIPFYCRPILPVREVPWCCIHQAKLQLVLKYFHQFGTFLSASTECHLFRADWLRFLINSIVLDVKTLIYVQLLHVVGGRSRSYQKETVLCLWGSFFKEKQDGLKQVIGEPSADRRIVNDSFDGVNDNAGIGCFVCIFKNFTNVEYFLMLSLSHQILGRYDLQVREGLVFDKVDSDSGLSASWFAMK